MYFNSYRLPLRMSFARTSIFSTPCPYWSPHYKPSAFLSHCFPVEQVTCESSWCHHSLGISKQKWSLPPLKYHSTNIYFKYLWHSTWQFNYSHMCLSLVLNYKVLVGRTCLLLVGPTAASTGVFGRWEGEWGKGRERGKKQKVQNITEGS